MDDETRDRINDRIEAMQPGEILKTDDLGIPRQELIQWARSETDRMYILNGGCLLRCNRRPDERNDTPRFSIRVNDQPLEGGTERR